MCYRSLLRSICSWRERTGARSPSHLESGELPTVVRLAVAFATKLVGSRTARNSAELCDVPPGQVTYRLSANHYVTPLHEDISLILSRALQEMELEQRALQWLSRSSERSFDDETISLIRCSMDFLLVSPDTLWRNALSPEE